MHPPCSSGFGRSFSILCLAGLTLPLPGTSRELARFSDRIEVGLLEIEVRVQDAAGNPAPGLGPENFQVLVSGKPLPIRVFEEVREGKLVQELMEPSGNRGGEAPLPPPDYLLPASEPSHQPGTADSPVSYLVLVDELFSTYRLRNHALRWLAKEVGATLGPEDRMAVAAVQGFRQRVLSPWTRDIPALEELFTRASDYEFSLLEPELEGIRSSLAFEAPGAWPKDKPGQDLPHRRSPPMSWERQEGDLGDVLRRIEELLHAFADAPRPRVVLLLSGGWPVCFELLDRGHDLAAGHRPPDVLAPGGGEHHADHTALCIDHRGARIAGLDIGVQLDGGPLALAVEGGIDQVEDLGQGIRQRAAERDL